MAWAPIIAAGAAVAGTAVAAYGQYQTAKAQSAAEKVNADILDQNARTARAQAAAEEGEVRRRAHALAGSQRAAIAEAGLELTGTAQDVIEQSAQDAELDALTVRYNGELAARGLLNERDAARGRSRTLRSGAPIGLAAGILSAAGQGYLGYAAATRGAGSTPAAPSYGRPHATRLGY